MLTYRPFLLSAVLFCLALVTFSSSAISEPQDVSLYLDGEPDGDLVLSDPDDEKTIIVASNDTSQGQEQVIGNWTFDSLLFETGTGDSWSGNIYVISTKDISVSITWSFCQPSDDGFYRFHGFEMGNS